MNVGRELLPKRQWQTMSIISFLQDMEMIFRPHDCLCGGEISDKCSYVIINKKRLV